jgi:anti-sigma regulatory factor (Ser/Thr protein kinase)
MPSQVFPAWANSVVAARRYVIDQLAAWSDVLPSQLCETAALLVSELATNAVRHSGAREFVVELDVVADEGRVWIGVTDDGPGYPTLRRPPPTAEHGRGLQLVGTLADRWGARRRRDSTRKTVWFELNATSAGNRGEATEVTRPLH